MTASDLKPGDRVRVTGNREGLHKYHFLPLQSEGTVARLRAEPYVYVEGVSEKGAPLLQAVHRKDLERSAPFDLAEAAA